MNPLPLINTLLVSIVLIEVASFWLLMRFIISYSTVDDVRYSLREGVNGRLQLSPRSSSEPFNGITAMHTWMLRNRMQLMCKLYILSYSCTT